MATLDVTMPTLRDYQSMVDPDGNIAAFIEAALVVNGIIPDMPIKEGNLTTGHRTPVQTGIPSVTWRKLNGRVLNSKGQQSQVDDTCGMAETFLEVDKALADLGGNTAAFLSAQARHHIIAFMNEISSKIFYGDSSVNPEQPLGFFPRYPYKDSPNVVDFGGSGSDCTSIMFVTWGENQAFGIYPKGSKVGLSHKHYGEAVSQNSDGSMIVYRDHFRWDIGLSVPDWRSHVRCCNIESAGLTGTSTNNLTDKMYLLVKAKNMIQPAGLGRTVIYCNADVKTQFDVWALNKTGPVTYTTDAGGKSITSFMGIPIVQCDAILSTETALIATP